MPSIETTIDQAIRQRVSTIPLEYPRVWTNDGTTDLPASGGQPAPYIECHYEPNKNVRPFVGSREANERPGILLLTLCWPVARVGSGAGKQPTTVIREIAASSIAGHFATDQNLSFMGTRVRVTRVPDVRASYRDDAYLRTQVSIMLETQR